VSGGQSAAVPSDPEDVKILTLARCGRVPTVPG